MYHGKYNIFIKLNLLRQCLYFVGGLKLAEIGKGDHFCCQNQSVGTGFCG